MSADLFRALGVMAERPTEKTAAVARALDLSRPPGPEEFTELFVMQLPPYASVYLGSEGMLGGEARDRVAGFWRALGFTPPAEADHLAALLGLYGSLSDSPPKGESDLTEQRKHAREALLWEHLSSWLPVYLERIREIGPRPYADWATLLADAILTERDKATSPPALPLHLRGAPSHLDPDGAAIDEVVDALLVPVKTGMIITRHDLARLAHDVGIGLRQGERRFILRALVDQDPARVFGWLELEARRRVRPKADRIGRFWSDRADRTAEVLGVMQSTAEKAQIGYARR